MLSLPNKLQSYIGRYKSQIDTQISKIIQPSFINLIAKHVAFEGKRMRPTILILIAKLLKAEDDESCIIAATGVELIHLASLLHDDVIDQSNFRHNKETAHIIFGNQQTILAGDFLFAESFKKMTELQNLEILNIISETSGILASGELQQLQIKEKFFELTLEDYYNIIYKKTASLFEASAKIGAILSNPSFELQAGQFGKSIGMAFQIIDDLLDYFSSNTKKKIGTDFYEGKITLPIIFALSEKSTLNKVAKMTLQELFLKAEKSEKDFNQILAILNSSEVEDFCFNIASNFCLSAKSIINEIDSKALEAEIIFEMIDFFLKRKF